MKMLNTFSNRMNIASRVLFAAIGLSALATPALGGEHTDFPDLSVMPSGGKGNGGGSNYLPPNKYFDMIIGHVVDDEGNAINDDSLVAPPFPPVPTLPEHGFGINKSVDTYGGSAPVGSNFSSVPTPGVGGLVVIGAAAAGLRRRRR